MKQETPKLPQLLAWILILLLVLFAIGFTFAVIGLSMSGWTTPTSVAILLFATKHESVRWPLWLYRSLVLVGGCLIVLTGTRLKEVTAYPWPPWLYGFGVCLFVVFVVLVEIYFRLPLEKAVGDQPQQDSAPSVG